MAGAKLTRGGKPVLHKHCMATWFFTSGEVGTQPCEVRFFDKKIVVAFVASGDYLETMWRGEELGKGHYKLRADDGYGEAALHRFDGGGYLDGYWEEDGEGSRDSGMIRIDLKDVYRPE